MISLLDVNVLVALFDPAHVHHEAAHEWFAANRREGWATCPITENGLLRVISSVSYPGRRTTLGDALERLRSFRRSGHHRFWPDSASLADEGLVDTSQVAGSRQLTDIYLLALAVAMGGRLASFDRRIRIAGVHGASSDSLTLVGG